MVSNPYYYAGPLHAIPQAKPEWGCAAVEVQVSIRTRHAYRKSNPFILSNVYGERRYRVVSPEVNYTGFSAAGYALGHIFWTIDGVPHPTPECRDPDGCEYLPGREYRANICLSPGKHTIELLDSMGYGWFGASVGIKHENPKIYAPVLEYATMQTPDACEQYCAVGGRAGTCLSHLFSTDSPHTCSTLQAANCSCAGCCVDTPDRVEQFHAAMPRAESNQPWKWMGGVASSKRVTFEVLADEIYLWSPPPPAPKEVLVTSETRIPCSHGLNGHRIEGLTLRHQGTYTAEVIAYDNAGNRATCRSAVRMQSPVLIDASPPQIEGNSSVWCFF
jgi:hypothetical protein